MESRVTTYLIATDMPGVGKALQTVESAVWTLVPLLVASVAVLVVAAGTFGGLTVNFVLFERAVGEAIRCAVAGTAVRSVLDADSRAVKLGDRTGVKSVYLWTMLKIEWRCGIHGSKNRQSGERGDLHFGCLLGIQRQRLV